MPRKRKNVTERSSKSMFAYQQAYEEFRVSGICPFNRQIFSELDFAPSYVTDRPDPNDLSVTSNSDQPLLLDSGTSQASSSRIPSILEQQSSAQLDATADPAYLRDSVISPLNSSAIPTSNSQDDLLSLAVPLPPQLSSQSQLSSDGVPDTGAPSTQASSTALQSNFATEMNTVTPYYPRGSVTPEPQQTFTILGAPLSSESSTTQQPSLDAVSTHFATDREIDGLQDLLTSPPRSNPTAILDAVPVSRSEIEFQPTSRKSTTSKPNFSGFKDVVSSSLLSKNSASQQLSFPTEADPLAIPGPSTKTFLPESVRPFPKATPRKSTRYVMKKKSTVYTDTPEKENIRIQTEERERKKNAAKVKTNMKNMKVMKKTTKKRKTGKKKPLKNSNGNYSSSEEEEELNDDESVSDVSDDIDQFDSSSCESSENATAPPSLGKEDWAIINLTSMKNLVHRYVGQIQNITRHGYIVKFAKRIDYHKFKWPVKDDIAEIRNYQVVKKINPPDVKSKNRRAIIFEFKKSLRKFKIE